MDNWPAGYSAFGTPRAPETGAKVPSTSHGKPLTMSELREGRSHPQPRKESFLWGCVEQPVPLGECPALLWDRNCNYEQQPILPPTRLGAPVSQWATRDVQRSLVWLQGQGKPHLGWLGPRAAHKGALPGCQPRPQPPQFSHRLQTLGRLYQALRAGSG